MAILDVFRGAKAAVTGGTKVLDEVANGGEAKPSSYIAPETQAVIDKFTLAGQRVQEKAEAITQSAKEQAAALMGKLGVRSAPDDAAALAGNVPSAREAAAALNQARLQSFEKMDNPLARTSSSTYWRDLTRRGPEVGAENTAAPQGALPPG